MNKSKKIKIISSVISCMGLATGFIANSSIHINDDGVKVLNENTNDIVDFDNLDNLFNNNAVGDTFNITPEGGIQIKCTILTEPTTEKNGTVSIQKVDDRSGHIIIPKLVSYNGNNYDVTTIQENAFVKSSQTSTTTYTGDLTIPNSIVSIGENAFQNSVYSDDKFFADSKLIFLAQTSFLPAYCFSNCDFTEVKILSKTVTEISSRVFERNLFTEIEMPSNITKIGRQAFSYSKLVEITFLSKSVIPYNDMFDSANDLAKINVSSNLIDDYKALPDWTGTLVDFTSKFVGITVDSIVLDQTDIKITDIDDKQPIKLNATVVGKYQDLVWSSSDESVVSVDKNGQLKYNGVGKATIKAESDYDSTKFATCEIEISKSLNLALILGLSLGLGIPIVAGIGFGTYYFVNKNKK